MGSRKVLEGSCGLEGVDIAHHEPGPDIPDLGREGPSGWACPEEGAEDALRQCSPLDLEGLLRQADLGVQTAD